MTRLPPVNTQTVIGSERIPNSRPHGLPLIHYPGVLFLPELNVLREVDGSKRVDPDAVEALFTSNDWIPGGRQVSSYDLGG